MVALAVSASPDVMFISPSDNRFNTSVPVIVVYNAVAFNTLVAVIYIISLEDISVSAELLVFIVVEIAVILLLALRPKVRGGFPTDGAPIMVLGADTNISPPLYILTTPVDGNEASRSLIAKNSELNVILVVATLLIIAPYVETLTAPIVI